MGVQILSGRHWNLLKSGEVNEALQANPILDWGCFLNHHVARGDTNKVAIDGDSNNSWDLLDRAIIFQHD
jgi:hypothetical protein